ncbi:MAG: hypothetical protein GQ542_03365 [Desulforhopalus sp.]|nr:hypothetical protein [Desulforhopalus sp.]
MRNICNVTKEVAEKYMTYLKNSDYATSTQANYVSRINQVYRHFADQNIDQTMLLEEKKALLERAQLELDECNEENEKLAEQLSLLRKQLEYIHFRVDKGFLSKGTFDSYLRDFNEQENLL